MNIFEQLKECDKVMIQDYIDTWVGELNPEAPKASLETILSEWAYQKEHLYHLFGDKFIIEMPIEYQKTTNAIEKDIAQLLDQYESHMHTLDGLYHNQAKEGCLYSVWKSWIFAQNKVDEYMEFELGDTIFKVQAGMKPMKVLKKFFEYFNYDMNIFEELRIKHSQLLNVKNVKGTLCLSIHPMDFFTMSDNAENWHSCMSWEHGGCYRRGTVECLNSPNLFVAYVKSNKQKMPCGWNSKKWRSLFAINNDVCISVKGYPYSLPDINKTVLNKIRELSGDKYKDVILEGRGFDSDSPVIFEMPENMRLESNYKCLELFFEYDSVMYNDFNTTDHYCIISQDFHDRYLEYNEYYKEYNIGSETVTCMHCGGHNCSYHDHGMLVCDDCEKSFICPECGRRIPYYAEAEVNGLIICEYCRDGNYRWCNFREMYTRKDESMWMHLIPAGTKSSIDLNQYLWRLSSRCISTDILDENSEEFSKYFKENTKFVTLRNGHPAVQWEDLTEAGLRVFNETHEEARRYYDSVFFDVLNELPF